MSSEELTGRCHWFESAGHWVAAAVALVFTLWRVSECSQWRDDLAIVRGLGLVPAGGEGVVSTLLMQLFALIPVGGRSLRAGAVSAVGLAITAALLFEITRRLLAMNTRAPVLGAALALAAALMATLSPSWQLEGTVAGGSSVAVALVLTIFLVRPTGPGDAQDARAWLGLGGLVGVTLMESHSAGLVALAGLGLQVLMLRELPTRRGVAALLTGTATSAGFCASLTFLRPCARRSWVDLGYDLTGLGLSGTDAVAERAGALSAWVGELGVVSLAIACFGLVWGLARQKTRWHVAPLVLFALADALLPASRTGVLSSDPLTAIRLLAVGATSALVALGVHTVGLGLRWSKVPFARPASVLLVVFDLTLVFVTAEDSAFATDRRGRFAVDVWTDEALGRLPPQSLVLVRTESIAWRMWAARVVRGTRPDVVVVPVHLLGQGSVAERLLELEPALADLVKDVAITGRPGEYSLSTLADRRPLFVELDPTWDRRLHEHLEPGALWMRFSPHALGRSDRTAALDPGFESLERIAAVANEPGRRHLGTLAVLQLRARDQALVLATLGDRESLERTLGVLADLDASDPFIGELRIRMEERRRGRVDIAGLLP